MTNVAPCPKSAIARAVAEVISQLRNRHHIAKALMPAAARATRELTDPATGKIIGTAPAAQSTDVLRAVQAAAAALPEAMLKHFARKTVVIDMR